MRVYGEAWHPERGTGQDAEVWSPFLGRWLHGFSIIGRDGDFLMIRRRADRPVLPVLFAASEVRLVGALTAESVPGAGQLEKPCADRGAASPRSPEEASRSFSNGPSLAEG
jgi:hypothetical protein